MVVLKPKGAAPAEYELGKFLEIVIDKEVP
jgi:hypothetical protein